MLNSGVVVTMNEKYESVAPSRAEVDALKGAAVIEFGTSWCGYCSRAQPLIAEAFSGHSSVQRIKIEDGPGRRLGRSFGVKLWPTLIFLSDGQEVARLVRPDDAETIRLALEGIDAVRGT